MQGLQRLSHAVGGLLFVSLFGVFVVQIGARFGFNQPLPWTDELAVVLYLFVIQPMTKFNQLAGIEAATKECPDCLSLIPAKAKRCKIKQRRLTSKDSNKPWLMRKLLENLW